MMKDIINNEYFEWMCNLVCDSNRFKKVHYDKLLSYLYDTEFTYLLDMDSNRAEDGIDLRYRFAIESKYSRADISRYLDYCPCSILEMMVALSLRCEENIMDDPDIGDRTGKWFWDMIVNLGLFKMNDLNFDLDKVSDIINIFLDREYEANGRGGLFLVRNSKYDIRTVEIWYQMCWYLDYL